MLTKLHLKLEIVKHNKISNIKLLILKSYGLTWLISRVYITYKHSPLIIILRF